MHIIHDNIVNAHIPQIKMTNQSLRSINKPLPYGLCGTLTYAKHLKAVAILRQ